MEIMGLASVYVIMGGMDKVMYGCGNDEVTL